MTHHAETPRRGLKSALAAALVAGAVITMPSEAAAQDVSPTGKGITGGVLLGSEVALITVGAIGVKSWWPYVLFGAVGAGGGAVGGYFVEQVDEAEPSLYMLAGGMALIVPTVVVVLNATAYDPTDDTEEDDELPPGEEPGLEGGIDVEAGFRPDGMPTALLDIDVFSRTTRYRVGLPTVQALPRFTQKEVATYGVDQVTEVRFPVLSGHF